jgi:hypothetical protein
MELSKKWSIVKAKH